MNGVYWREFYTHNIYCITFSSVLFFSAVDAGITILNEVGLDPGIDHMTAMECFDEVRDHGGKVRKGTFKDRWVIKGGGGKERRLLDKCKVSS